MDIAKEERLKQTDLISHYIPLKIGLTLIAFIAFIGIMHDELATRFLANVPLNSLIVGTTIIAIGVVLRNVFMLEGAANFLRRLEKFEEAPTEAESMKIFKALRKKASLINTALPGRRHFRPAQARQPPIRRQPSPHY